MFPFKYRFLIKKTYEIFQGEETSADLEAHLFVGDREGLKKAKKETRKIASSGAYRYNSIMQ